MRLGERAVRGGRVVASGSRSRGRGFGDGEDRVRQMRRLRAMRECGREGYMMVIVKKTYGF